MKRSRRIVAALLFGGVLTLALLEVALRAFFVDDGVLMGTRPLPPFGATTNAAQRTWVREWRERFANGIEVAGVAEFRMDLGWSMRKSASGGGIVTNALGARGDREYPTRPEDGTLRIACFGDSFTYADGVADDETWATRMENATRNLEVLNFGVGGYGTDQAWIRYRVDGRELGAHVVAIGIMLDDIGRNVNRFRPWYFPGTRVVYAKPRFTLDTSGTLTEVPLPYASFREYLDAVHDGSVLTDLREHEYWYGPRPFGSSLVTVRLAAGAFAYLARDHRRCWEDATGEPRRVTLAILEEFHRQALSEGAASAPILVFPAQTDLDALLTEGRAYWTGAFEGLRADGIPVLDLSESLAEHCRDHGLAAADLYAGGHLDPEANGIVAEAFLAWLDASLGPDLPAIERRY